MSLRFTRVEDDSPKHDTYDWGEYDKKSLCSIFETVERVRRERMYSQ